MIKANVPSRIAFAMASNIDSRTVLDAPGAEDLIGRGDMLYQPSDLPRPMRLQGVFVSDHEIGRIVGQWKDQVDNPHYDMAILESDEEGTSTTRDVNDEEADRLLPDAVEVIREYDRASRVAAPAAPQGRLREGRPDDRPARGPGLHRGVRRIQRKGRAAPGRFAWRQPRRPRR